MKDFTLQDFTDMVNDLHKSQREEQIRRNKQDKIDDANKKRRVKDILKLRHVHERTDALVGLYPITKEKLLEQVELMNNGTMNIDSYGNMFSAKIWYKLMLTSDYLEMNSEQLYDLYITQIKPLIF
jgi:hypothetical protein